MRLVIPLEERTRLEQRLGAAIPPPATNAFKSFLEELKTKNPELALEIESAVKPLGVPTAVKVQANKARENAKLASVGQRLFMKETSDGFVVDKRKIGAWTAGFAAVALLVGAAAVAVRPAPPSSLSLSGVLGNGDATASLTSGTTTTTKPGAKPGDPAVSSATSPQEAPGAGSAALVSASGSRASQRAEQGARASSSSFPSPNAVARPSRPIRPAADVRTTSYVVQPSGSSFPAPSGVSSSVFPSSAARPGATGGLDELDAPSTNARATASRTPSGTTASRGYDLPAANGLAPRRASSSGVGLPRLALRPIAVQGSRRPLVPKAGFSVQPVGPAQLSVPGSSSVAASSVTTPTASGLAISARDPSGQAQVAATPSPGLSIASSEPAPARSAPGLALGSRDQPAPLVTASGGIGISSQDARSSPAASTPPPTGGIGFTATTPNVPAQNGFPGATTAQAGSPPAQPGGLPGAPAQGLESALPNLYTGMKLEASLTVAVVAVEQNVAPFVAVTKNPPCGKPECAPITWIGQALLGPDRRVWVSIDQASYLGQTYAVRGQALGLEDVRPGLAAEVSEEAPTLVSDLLRGVIGGFSDYLSAQLGSKTTTIISGGGAVSSGTVPDLVNFFGGRAAGLFSLPSDAKALIRVARVAPDSRLLVLYGVPVVLGGGQR